MTRQLNDAGKALIEGFESCRLRAYICPAGKLTVGFGHTGPEVHTGMTITQAQADAIFEQDAAKFCAAVERLAGHASDDQFAALVSFAFNEGAQNLASSTLLRKHNSGAYAGAAAEFANWNKAHVDGKLVVLSGLTTRRAAEEALYKKGSALL